MRLRTIIMAAILFIFTMTGCSPVGDTTKLVFLLKLPSGIDIYLDPQSVQVDKQVFAADIHFVSPLSSSEAKTVVWSTIVWPSSRTMSRSAIKFYDTSGKLYKSNQGDQQSFYVEPGQPMDDIMKAIVEYCKTRNLPLDTTPRRYLTLGFQYVGTSPDNNLFFYNPASLQVKDDYIEYNVMFVYELKGKKIYAIATAQDSLTKNKIKIGLSTHYYPEDQVWTTKPETEWQEREANSFYAVVHQKLLDYCRANNITLPN